jgi:GNAT superfamily N-acetyltransferase
MTQLRVASSGDIPVLRDLISYSVRGLSTRDYSTAQIETALRYLLGVDSQLVADGTYYVIESDATIIAAGGWSARRTLYGGDQSKGDADLPIDPATSPARIRAFFVHPEYARRGLARQIYAACEDAARARGFRRFELVATMPGVPLYRALGFIDVEAVDVPLPDGLSLPCIRMERPIYQMSPTVNPSGNGSSGSSA